MEFSLDYGYYPNTVPICGSENICEIVSEMLDKTEEELQKEEVFQNKIRWGINPNILDEILFSKEEIEDKIKSIWNNFKKRSVEIEDSDKIINYLESLISNIKYINHSKIKENGEYIDEIKKLEKYIEIHYGKERESSAN